MFKWPEGGPLELSPVLYQGVFGSEVVRIIFCSMTVARCHPGPGHGQGSAQLSQDIGGLNVVAFFSSRSLCVESHGGTM